MLEWLTPGLVYTVGKDILSRIVGKRRRLTPAQIVELRQKWKPLFESRLHHTHQNGLREDVIIRDMKRMDAYPDHHDGKGISPWFRLFLVDTYHRGILVAHRWVALKKHNEKWRYTNHQAGEQGDIDVAMLSSIPYESIENVDWDGDQIYDYPHIYCYFDRRKEPYERTAFYVETKPHSGNRPFYTEVATYDEVRKLSRKLGLPNSG
jgi:hypothetical protein